MFFPPKNPILIRQKLNQSKFNSFFVQLSEHVIIMAVVLLVALFIFQQCGTSKVSFSFSPIMLMWFGSNIAIGVYNIVKYEPSVFKALSPHYIIIFFSRNGVTGWTLLGAIFLCITGMFVCFSMVNTCM